jgi:SAM-dependent methyltransferase
MGEVRATAEEQRQLWSGTGGRGWVELQGELDRLYQPLENRLLEGICAGSATRVLDVGCGTGGTTIAMARLLGANGQCVGVDISEPMLAAAQARAQRHHTPAIFIHADAGTYAFESASFDMIISRLGVMFFDEPVRAFGNLRLAAKGAAQLRFVAWRSDTENPFLTAAQRAAASLLPNLSVFQPNLPGPFAFADQDRVNRILQASGWTEVDIRPVDIPCAFPEGELVRLLRHVGPVGRALQGADEETRRRVVETIRPAFDSFLHAAEIRFVAACWIVSAHAPARVR